jgi:hypothetical protein
MIQLDVQNSEPFYVNSPDPQSLLDVAPVGGCGAS